MTLRLILMRHAKSAWDSPTLSDHDRPLNDRGRRSASAIGGWLQANGYVPDLVLSSDAARTRETWALVAQELQNAPDEVVWLEQLYLAAAQTILNTLRATTGEQDVLMLGHNPGFGNFAEMIVRTPPRHTRFRDYPTAATAVIDFDAAQWRDVDWGMGQIVDFTVPRDLNTT